MTWCVPQFPTFICFFLPNCHKKEKIRKSALGYIILFSAKKKKKEVSLARVGGGGGSFSGFA